jgi:chloramphenicol-sensitive protein RarD
LNKNKLGLLFGISAYSLWGLFPLYWPLLEPASALEIVSHRAVWTLVFCIIVIFAIKTLKETLVTFRRPKVVAKLFVTSILISINWLVYIWAANNGHVVEASLGYYINPLITIGFGVFLLKEKLRALQWFSVSVATVGVSVLTIAYGRLPWIAIALALSWGSYGLMKKQLGLGALEGIAIETFISAFFYLAYLVFLGNQGTGQFGNGWGQTLLLMSAGAATAIPLLLFNGAANRLPFTTIGLLQYITPTLQFSCGVWIYHEEMPLSRWIGFFIIWVALIALAIDLVRSNRSVNDGVA